MPTLAERYAEAFPTSAARFRDARTLFPCGVTHDTRMMEPFPISIDRARGSKKYDPDGHEFVDYFVGHGSHILGHSHPAVVEAVRRQMELGTHPGSSHALEIEWATLIRELVPSAERVRFTGSGTEATMMALRLARLSTGRPKFLKFQGHFHGWHDAVTIGADYPYDAPTVAGVTPEMAHVCVAIPPNDLNLVDSTLAADKSIGAVILEPTGGHWGAVPISGAFLREVREICTRHEVVLIFDEVITGFRVSPGGAQAYYGVTPDLTAFAKIVAGGLPGGCVVGRADIMNFIEPRPGRPKMRHPGTYNGNPLSASAGIACLKEIRTGEPSRLANEAGRILRNQLNAMFEANRWPWIAYGQFSMVRVLPNYHGERPAESNTEIDGLIPFQGELNALDGVKDTKLGYGLRQGMLLNGVDFWGTAGMTSAAHSADDVAATVHAMEATLADVRAEGWAT